MDPIPIIEASAIRLVDVGSIGRRGQKLSEPVSDVQ